MSAYTKDDRITAAKVRFVAPAIAKIFVVRSFFLSINF